MNRLWAAGIVLVLLAGLGGWQMRRARLMADCSAASGVWDGRRSACMPIGRPILERDLRRS